ncbi:superinfection immunity protein [Flavobacterium sp. SE-s28]|uniref:Superinfection immunity protein n=2 Tax=Flavobacterium silvaticum TaxID=1852020 RepID=A0A972JF15_9FLAO|nr:superinfection immunity protein [Flavobacterium silvaticum]
MAGIFAAFVYFIPTVIARDKINFKLVLVMNLLVGWTILGWFISFAFAMKGKNKNPDPELSGS